MKFYNTNNLYTISFLINLYKLLVDLYETKYNKVFVNEQEANNTGRK